MPRYKALIEYDGTPFFGWQKQSGLITVQSVLEDSVRPLLKCNENDFCIYGAGRTDTGVHAIGQVAHFDLDIDRDPFSIMQCMNSNLREFPVSVLLVERTAPDFHARFDAKMREYRYVILNRRPKPALEVNRAWWVIRELDEIKMHDAAQLLVGKHDLSSFRAHGCQALSPVKTVTEISVTRDFDKIYIDISAPSFLYHQVRNIVGSLYNVGIGKWDKNDFFKLIAAKNRSLAGVTAPACGLYFQKVSY